MSKIKVSLGLLLISSTISGFLFVKAGADTGSANATLTLNVPVKTVVSCSSPAVTAEPGTNALAVTCSISGNPTSLANGTANSFGPSNVNLTNGSGGNLQAALQSNVTSPDGTVSNIGGSSSGFTGTINTLPAKVQATYHVTTTSSTKAGTYTGITTYTWSTI